MSVESIDGINRVARLRRMPATLEHSPTPEERVEQVQELQRQHVQSRRQDLPEVVDPRPTILDVERLRTPDDQPPGPTPAEVDAAYRAAIAGSAYGPAPDLPPI